MGACPRCRPRRTRRSRRGLQLTRGGNCSHHTANRKIVCLQTSETASVIVVFLSKQVTCMSLTSLSHSAGHDIFCKHGLLQESSCSNMRFVCKITLIPAFEEITVCVCVCVANPCRLYGWLKAVKGLLMMAVFTHSEIRQVSAVGKQYIVVACGMNMKRNTSRVSKIKQWKKTTFFFFDHQCAHDQKGETHI